jgi:predicted RNase H-like HicB family nuclease
MRRVTVVIEGDDAEGWQATSPDIEGYIAVAETEDALRELVYDGVPWFLEEPVEIIEVRADTATATAV